MAHSTTTTIAKRQINLKKPPVLGPLFHFLEHQFIGFRTTFRGTVVSGAIGPLMYLLGIGLGIGSQIDAQESGLGTTDYLQFVGPGLMAAAAMQSGASESLWQTAGQLRFRGTYISVTNTPLTTGHLFIGHVLWIGFRVLVGSALYLAVLLAFGVPTSPLALLSPFAAVLTGMAFGSIISAWTGYTTKEQTFPVILRLGILPMYLFSGAFYPVSQLPIALEWFSKFTPVWHVVRLCRGLIIQQDLTLTSALGHVGVLAAYIAVGLFVGTRTFRKTLGS